VTLLNHALEMEPNAQLMDSNHPPLFADHQVEYVISLKHALETQSPAQLIPSNHLALYVDNPSDHAIHLNHALDTVDLAQLTSTENGNHLALDFSSL
jgi:hypothetical protein